MKTLIVVTAAVVLAMSGTASAAPTLTTKQAARAAKAAIKSALYTNTRTDVHCVRRTDAKQVCAVTWPDGLGRYSGNVTITRTGLDVSPIDSYKIVVTRRSKYLQPRKTVKAGKLVVPTRRAVLGQALQLLGYDGGDLEIAPPAPPVDPFVSPNEFTQPGDGARFVALNVAVRNIGKVRRDSGLSEARLITAAGATIDQAFTVGCELPDDMAPGEQRVGCLAFEVPYGETISQLEVPGVLETGIWRW